MAAQQVKYGGRPSLRDLVEVVGGGHEGTFGEIAKDDLGSDTPFRLHGWDGVELGFAVRAEHVRKVAYNDA